MLGEIVAITLGVLGIVAAVYRGVRWTLDANHKARRDSEALARIAQWFPEEHPNGEVSLPTQVRNLQDSMTGFDHRLKKVETATKRIP